MTELDEHVARLGRSADGLGIELPADIADRLARGIRDLLAAEALDGPDGDASIRITVSRGVYHGRGLLPPEVHTTPTIAIQAWPVAPPPAGHLEQGIHLASSSVRRDPQNPLAMLKTTSRADYVYARLEARAGADDALFLTIEGLLSEATSANLPGPSRAERRGRAGYAGTRLRDPARHHAIVAARLGGARRPPAGRGVADAARPGRRGRGVRVVERGRDPAGDAVRRSRHRHGTARTVGSPRPRGPRGVHPRRGAGMTRDELIARTRQLIDEGDRLAAEPSLGALQVWLQLSDDLLSTAWGSMDRYHLAWLLVGKPKGTIRGRAMTAEEEAAYVREVAEQKTAALRMSLDAVERQGMPFLGETGGVGHGGQPGRSGREWRAGRERRAACQARAAPGPVALRAPGRRAPPGRGASRPRRATGAAPSMQR